MRNGNSGSQSKNSKNILGWTLYIFILLSFLTVSCTSSDKADPNEQSPGQRKAYLRSAIQAIEVSDDYVYCDSSAKGDSSCFINYKRRRFLKQYKIYFDSVGNSLELLKYKPEGFLSYNLNELQSDTLLVHTTGWQMKNNMVEFDGDKLLRFSENAAEIDEQEKTIKLLFDHPTLKGTLFYQFQYW